MFQGRGGSPLTKLSEMGESLLDPGRKKESAQKYFGVRNRPTRTSNIWRRGKKAVIVWVRTTGANGRDGVKSMRENNNKQTMLQSNQ